jgi:hypothetical protein
MGYWRRFGKYVLAATEEQVVGALLAFGILVSQIRYGVVHREDVHASYLAIAWPYLYLVCALFLWHTLKTFYVLYRERGTELVTLRSDLATSRVKPRITSKDWQELSIEAEKCSGLRVDHNWNSNNEHSWHVAGGPQYGICEQVLRRAGNMLLRSPSVNLTLTKEVSEEADSLVRWMLYMKNHDAFVGGGSLQGYSHEGDVRVNLYSTSTRDLKSDFVRLCHKCAALET